MKIVELKAQNVKRLRAVRIKPDGSMVVVGGKNAAGKSSVLDSIAMALGGKKLCPDEPIRRGEKRAEIAVDLGGLQVTRTFSKAGSTSLTVTDKAGSVKKPQQVLDKLAGSLAFDPLAFLNMDRGKQAETLREIVGVDFSRIDATRERLYNERTDVNREAKRLRATAEEFEIPEDLPDKPFTLDDLMQELRRVETHNKEALSLEGRVKDLSQAVKNKRDGIAIAHERIEDLMASLGRERQNLQELKTRARDADAALAAARDAVAAFEPIDPAEVRQKIEDREKINAAIQQQDALAGAESQAAALEEKAATLTEGIEALDKQKADAIAAADLGVEGLSFDEDGVSLNGLPFDQASSAEQLRASAAVGLAAHPKLKILLIRDGSLLDDDSLRLLGNMAMEAGAQVWLERVGDGEECSVIIEDGEVKGGGGC